MEKQKKSHTRSRAHSSQTHVRTYTALCIKVYIIHSIYIKDSVFFLLAFSDSQVYIHSLCHDVICDNFILYIYYSINNEGERESERKRGRCLPDNLIHYFDGAIFLWVAQKHSRFSFSQLKEINKIKRTQKIAHANQEIALWNAFFYHHFAFGWHGKCWTLNQ